VAVEFGPQTQLEEEGMANQLFATKPIDELLKQAGDTEHGLKRTLGAVDLVMLGVGAIIGAGIFVLTGQAAAQHAGPAIVLSFIFAGIACAFAGLCYAEMASMIPIAGSAYTYSYATMGELLAWIIGWDLILEYTLGAATVSVGWSGYVVSFLNDLGIHIPIQYTGGPWTKVGEMPDGTPIMGIINLPAIFIAVVVTTLLVIGIRESANVNTAVVFIKVGVVIAFILAGMWYVNRDNWTPFIPPNTGKFGEFGISGILTGAGVIFFAYIGFDAVSTAAQEARDPQKHMPVGIMGSLAMCTVLYIAVAAVLTGIVPYTQLNVPAPIALAINATGLAWMKYVIKIGAIAGLSSVILVMTMAQPRIFWIMAGDGLLPQAFNKVHPRFRTPYVTTILTGTAVAVLGGLFPIGDLGHMVSIGTLFAFLLVCAGVWVLRFTRPEIRRPFKVPAIWLVSPLGVITCFYLMYGLPKVTWERLVVWMALGLAIYIVYGIRRSKVSEAAGRNRSTLLLADFCLMVVAAIMVLLGPTFEHERLFLWIGGLLFVVGVGAAVVDVRKPKLA
jgi:APA family basic amino acid/polyamine antiporter